MTLASSGKWLLRNHVNGDVAWYLYASERVADGAVIYRDVTDTNPPLIYAVHLPFAWLARFLHIPTHVPFFIGTLGLLAAVLAVSARLLSRLRLFSEGWVYPTLAFVTVDFGIWNRADFGQRDHIAAYFFLPFLLLAALRARDIAAHRRDIIIVSAMASIGVALKPYFLAPYALLFAAVACRRGIRRTILLPEMLTVIVFNGVYWAVVCTHFGSYVSILRMGLSYYGVYDCQTEYLLTRFLLSAIILSGAVLLARTEAIRITQTLNAALCLGFMLDIATQHKGWSYHFVPLWFFTKLGVVLAAGGVLNTVRGLIERWHLGGIVPSRVSIAILGGLTALYAARMGDEVAPTRNVDQLVSEIRRNAAGPEILVLSTDMWITFPAVYEAQLRLALPTGALWTLAGMYLDQIQSARMHEGLTTARYHTYEEAGPDERELLSSFRQALARRPGIILVQGTEQDRAKYGFGSLGFDFLDYMAQDQALRLALADYRLAASGRANDIPYRLLVLRRIGDSETRPKAR